VKKCDCEKYNLLEEKQDPHQDQPRKSKRIKYKKN